ncbi:DNA polymerase III subunit gamma/tau [Algoriphagus aestuarii]|nr:DNA polymerase III subunit gamma/tau [Algoriphagus aestuarii]
MQKTMAIPTSLSHTKKILAEKAKMEEAKIEQKKAEVKTDEPVNSLQLTQEKLEEVMPSVIDHYKNQNKVLELAILNQPSKMEGHQICFEVMGHVQEEIAQKMKPELLSLIRDLTGVGKLAIKLVVKEELESTTNKLYTSSDKFRFLKEKHPALLEFQRKFGLETDF